MCYNLGSHKIAECEWRNLTPFRCVLFLCLWLYCFALEIYHKKRESILRGVQTEGSVNPRSGSTSWGSLCCLLSLPGSSPSPLPDNSSISLTLGSSLVALLGDKFPFFDVSFLNVQFSSESQSMSCWCYLTHSLSKDAILSFKLLRDFSKTGMPDCKTLSLQKG